MTREEIRMALNCCQDVHRSGRWSTGCSLCPLRNYENLKDISERCTEKMLKEAEKEMREMTDVVRCKDCKFGDICIQNWNGVEYVECHAHDEEGYDPEPGHPLDWFCADGKRKDGDSK